MGEGGRTQSELKPFAADADRQTSLGCTQSIVVEMDELRLSLSYLASKPIVDGRKVSEIKNIARLSI